MPNVTVATIRLAALTLLSAVSATAADAPLPAGVEVVWDLRKAYRETTPTRERICINGLWRWQPASADVSTVPGDDWGYFKVPGPWPGITDYLQKDSQTVYAHPTWRDTRLRDLTAAWYQREITVPANWTGRRWPDFRWLLYATGGARQRCWPRG